MNMIELELAFIIAINNSHAIYSWSQVETLTEYVLAN